MSVGDLLREDCAQCDGKGATIKCVGRSAGFDSYQNTPCPYCCIVYEKRIDKLSVKATEMAVKISFREDSLTINKCLINDLRYILGEIPQRHW